MAHTGRINQTDQVSEHRSDRPESPDRTDDRSKGLTDLYHYFWQIVSQLSDKQRSSKTSVVIKQKYTLTGSENQPVLQSPT